MSGFVKIYDRILDSSLWVGTDSDTKVVWITMLAMADLHGFVAASPLAIAHRAVVPLKRTEAALEVLASPDEHSGSPELDGRRVVAENGGFQIVNYAKYREMRTASQIRQADYTRRWREKKAAEEAASTDKPKRRRKAK